MGDWKDALKEIMHEMNPSEENINYAKRIKNENIPTKLFKYQTFSENKLKSLENDYTWCACAETFNDPYDSAIPSKLSEIQLDKMFKTNLLPIIETTSPPLFSFEELKRIKESKSCREAYQQITKLKLSSGDYQGFRLIAKNLEDLFRGVEEKYSQQIKQSAKKGLKISCFSENLHSMPMWYHYAERHEGFVIEYNFAKNSMDDLISDSLWPVIYGKSIFDIIPHLLFVIETTKINMLIPFTISTNKSKDWSYEQEWRLIVKKWPSDPDYNVEIPPAQAVYLGKNVKDKDKERMIEISGLKRFPLYKMELSETEFKMIPHRVEI